MTRRMLPTTPRLAALVAGLLVLAGAGSSARVEKRFAVDDLTYTEARAPTPPATAPARATATWCGTPTREDLVPNAVAGNPVHWIYTIPADGSDRFSTYASAMQAAAESIEAWWRSQDSTRVPRNDLAAFPCGTQLDLSLARLSLSSSQLGSEQTRFGSIANALVALGFSSRFTKFLVYYDGPVEPDLCGQGASNSTGLGSRSSTCRRARGSLRRRPPPTSSCTRSAPWRTAHRTSAPHRTTGTSATTSST